MKYRVSSIENCDTRKNFSYRDSSAFASENQHAMELIRVLATRINLARKFCERDLTFFRTVLYTYTYTYSYAHDNNISAFADTNGNFFLKYSLSAFREARTHFGSNQAIFHPFQGRNFAIFAKLNMLAKRFIRHSFYSSLFSYKNMQISN